MPPRHHYWTIIFGNQPTSFRAATREELLPTFRQIQARHPDAVMMWFASGRLWRSEEEFHDARFKRREQRRPDGRDRSRDPRGPGPDWRDRSRGPKPTAFARKPFTPGSGEAAAKRRDREDWRDRPRGPKPPAFARKPFTPDSGEAAAKRRDRGDWRDKTRDREVPPSPPKDRWRDRPVPPPGGDEKRGRDWRPGGQHKDPRDRFKVPRDVKRARFKQKAWRDRTHPKPPAPPKPRNGEPGKPRRGEGGPKKKDEE